MYSGLVAPTAAEVGRKIIANAAAPTRANKVASTFADAKSCRNEISIDQSLRPGKMLKKHRRFRDKIWEIAADEGLFNVDLEEDAKNSPKRSSGT